MTLVIARVICVLHPMPAPKNSWRIALIGHFGMGAIMGMLLSLSLVVGNYAHILDMIENSSTPSSMLLLVVGFFSSTFALGATLTGFLFTAAERTRSDM